jgi:hypothetical protein
MHPQHTHHTHALTAAALPPLPQLELSRLLYPVFVHCYLALVEKGATGLASNLMDRYKRRMDDMAARPVRWVGCGVLCGLVK